MANGCPNVFCDALLTRVDGDPEIFVELCDIFLDDAPKRLDAIRLALAAGDVSGVRAAAHAYKGAASVFDATDIVTAARMLEQLADEGDLRGGGALLATLERRSEELLSDIAIERADPRWKSS